MKKLIGLVAAVLLLGGCASVEPPADATASLAQYTPGELPEKLECGGREISREAFSNPVPATTLAPDVIDGIEGSGWLESPIENWSIVTQSDEYVALWRKLSEAEAEGSYSYAGPILFSSVVFSTGPAAMWSPTPWSYYGGGPCAMRIPFDDLTTALVTLDPERLPEPEDTTLNLLVTEAACNSGEDATGRIELVELGEYSDAIEIVIGVQRNSGGTCPSNPPTPFAVELSAPLGERVLLDGAGVPALEIAEPAPWG